MIVKIIVVIVVMLVRILVIRAIIIVKITVMIAARSGILTHCRLKGHMRACIRYACTACMTGTAALLLELDSEAQSCIYIRLCIHWHIWDLRSIHSV